MNSVLKSRSSQCEPLGREGRAARERARGGEAVRRTSVARRATSHADATVIRKWHTMIERISGDARELGATWVSSATQLQQPAALEQVVELKNIERVS